MESAQVISRLRYAFFPGCVSRGACRELSAATALITDKLGIEFVD